MEDAHRRGDAQIVRHLSGVVRDVDPGNPLAYGLALAYGPASDPAPFPVQQQELEDAGRTAEPNDAAGSQRSRASAPDAQRDPERTAPATRETPDRSGYDALLRVANRSRTSALETGAAARTLSSADALRARAASAAREGRFSEGERLLEQAREGYENARAAALWTARLDSVRTVVATSRSAARGDARTEGGRWETRASEAAADGRYVEALQSYERALQAYRTPPPAPATEPSAERAPVTRNERPAVEAALQRIARAIESENVGALLEVWPSLDARQQANFRALFSGTRDIRVTFDVRSIDIEQDRATASLQTTYDYFNESRRAADSASFPQTLIFSRRDGSWIVTGSR